MNNAQKNIIKTEEDEKKDAEKRKFIDSLDQYYRYKDK